MIKECELALIVTPAHRFTSHDTEIGYKNCNGGISTPAIVFLSLIMATKQVQQTEHQTSVPDAVDAEAVVRQKIEEYKDRKEAFPSDQGLVDGITPAKRFDVGICR